MHINYYFNLELKNLGHTFPGTVKDFIRDNKESFNIEHQEVMYLFDKKKNKL